MTTLADIDQAAETYRARLDHLLTEAEKLDAKLRRIKGQHAPVLRRAANDAAHAQAALERLVDDAPDLFTRPRTRTLHGIKVGVRTTPAALSVPDEAATIARIEDVLPGYQDRLIQTKRSVVKKKLWDLGRSMLAQLGVSVVEATDETVVQPVERDGLKLADQLLQAAESAAAQDGGDTRQAQGAA